MNDKDSRIIVSWLRMAATHVEQLQEQIERLSAEVTTANARERKAFMAGLESAIGYDELGDIDEEQEWQQYRCLDDTDWKATVLGRRTHD